MPTEDDPARTSDVDPADDPIENAPASSNPAIPGTPRDRTGSTLLLRKAHAAINERWKRLTTDVLTAFDRIPVYALNDTGPQVAYGITPAILDIVLLEIAAALDRWVQNGKEPKELFWWNPFVEQASQLGVLQSVTNLITCLRSMLPHVRLIRWSAAGHTSLVLPWPA